MCVCVCVTVCVWLCVCACVIVCVCVCVCVCVDVCVCVYMCVCVNICKYACMIIFTWSPYFHLSSTVFSTPFISSLLPIPCYHLFFTLSPHSPPLHTTPLPFPPSTNSHDPPFYHSISVINHLDISADGRFLQSNCSAYELLFSDTQTGWLNIIYMTFVYLYACVCIWV